MRSTNSNFLLFWDFIRSVPRLAKHLPYALMAVGEGTMTGSYYVTTAFTPYPKNAMR